MLTALEDDMSSGVQSLKVGGDGGWNECILQAPHHQEVHSKEEDSALGE